MPHQETPARQCITEPSPLRHASVEDTPCFIDPETGLPTPPLFRDRLERAWLTVGRTNGVLGVAQIRIESSTGDFNTDNRLPVIRGTMADRANRVMRQMDSLTFVSDGQLWFLVPQAHSLAGVQTAVTRLLDVLAEPISTGAGEIRLALRAGVTVGRPPDSSVDELLQQAMDALSRATARNGAPSVASFVDAQADPQARYGPPAAPDAGGGREIGHPDGPCVDCLDPSARESLSGVANWDEWVRRRSH